MLKIFVFIDISFVKQDIQKCLKNKDVQFFMENLKMKRKKKSKFADALISVKSGT